MSYCNTCNDRGEYNKFRYSEGMVYCSCEYGQEIKNEEIAAKKYLTLQTTQDRINKGKF